MRLPLSVHARVVIGAILLTVATLGVTAYAIVNIVTWVISDNMDMAVDAQVRLLTQAVDQAGAFEPERMAMIPDLEKPSEGWGWQVTAGNGRWDKAVPPVTAIYPWPRIHPWRGIYSGRGMTALGEQWHVRRLDIERGGHKITVIVFAPSTLIDAPLHHLRRTIYRSLFLVLLVLVAASLLQLRYGLLPLRRLSRDVLRVRTGEAQGLPDVQPAELAPLANEINALIARNDAGLAAARVNAANLAHAVKTPLSALMLQLEHEGASAESRALVANISDRVAHHLRRARSGAARLGTRARSDVHEALETVLPAIRWSERGGDGPCIENRLPQPCFVTVETEDLSEMLGNILENAHRYARRTIRVDARSDGPFLAIAVEDDGMGVPADEVAHVLQPGVRLDEVSEGYGFGLAIVRELVELYGGRLSLDRSAALGGLRISLWLPR
ncbi:sensor histidine kinase [Sphingomonas oryzagri]|uniref:histidine kinase n=1 Tax=Sphingomonas oryzagri TaxID=3042314 RepID=A0ABT6N2Q3_9SPHN|nr:HAMP domain-containing sensor histidine kinase [Sphingomonas oryzagri]MDH7639326.1 HAMP domain-containing sensor histidine kinase [Sphingomonas oryzagri]